MMVTPSRASLTIKGALWLVSGTAGAVLFWWVQRVTGGATIPDFMGQQIAEAGGYPTRVAPIVGWAVHLGVSLSYAFLFGVIVLLLTASRIHAQVVISAVIAVALGWITAILAPPAISMTIGILSGRGWPSDLFPLNTELGLPFWNHVGFFLLNWVVQSLGPRVVRTGVAPSAAGGR